MYKHTISWEKKTHASITFEVLRSFKFTFLFFCSPCFEVFQDFYIWYVYSSICTAVVFEALRSMMLSHKFLPLSLNLSSAEEVVVTSGVLPRSPSSSHLYVTYSEYFEVRHYRCKQYTQRVVVAAWWTPQILRIILRSSEYFWLHDFTAWYDDGVWELRCLLVLFVR